MYKTKLPSNINIWSYATFQYHAACLIFHYFQVRYIKVGNLGVLHKTRYKSDHQTLTFGIMHLFNPMHPRGTVTTSTMAYFSLRHLRKFSLRLLFSKKICFHCTARPLIRALGTKNTNASVSVLKKRPIKISKHKEAHYLYSLEPLGHGCCAVCVMWCDAVRCGGTREEYAFFTIKKMHIYLIDC